MARYRWATPHDWLREMADGWSAETLYHELIGMSGRLDGDAVQDLFQDMMKEDNYFQDLDITKQLTREQCVQLLEGIYPTFSDNIDDLRDAIQSHIEEGTVAYEDVETMAKQGAIRVRRPEEGKRGS